MSINTSHWAYQQGHAVGLTGDRAERGLMVFGLTCAGDYQTVINTRHWLAGFDAGEIEARERAEAAKNALHENPYDFR